MRSRPGMTLVELLVATMLLAIGALAIVGSSVATMRAVTAGRRASSGARSAGAQLEREIAAGCDSARTVAVLRSVQGTRPGERLYAYTPC